MNTYEVLLITKTEQDYKLVRELFEKHEVKIINEDVWGMRKLAYVVNKSDTGYYVVLNVKAGSKAINTLAKKLKLEDSILRSLIFTRESMKLEAKG